MAAPLNPADPHYRTILNQLFPEVNRDQDEAQRTFDLILANDEEGLRTWVSDPVKGARRVNEVATKMLLHPLHVCAMTGSVECARVLIETKVCLIDPQDASKATPLHHAAVRNNRAMIAYLLKNKASQLLDRFGGSYVNILRQMQAPDPDKQTVWYKNEKGTIVKGNGRDFKSLTDALFLESDCRITPEEWLSLWQKEATKPDLVPPSPEEQKEKIKPGLMPPSLKRRYGEFLANPPKLYLENHPRVRWNICAGQDIQPGQVIGEYLADFRQGADVIPPVGTIEEMEKRHEGKEYIYGDMDATHWRGLMGMCNDSFPNTRVFEIYNQRGLPVRHVLVAIHPIKKGDPIVYSYGLGQSIRFAQRFELRREAFFKYFQDECANGFARFFSKAISLNNRAISEGRLPEAEENLPIQALLYVLTTPAAMLHLLCNNIIQIRELKPLFEDKEMLEDLQDWFNAKSFPLQWSQLEHFYQTAFTFFEESDARSIKRLQDAIDSTDTKGLIQLMGGDPEGYIIRALLHQFLPQTRTHRKF